MKRKIYKSLSVAVIAVAVAVSFQMSRANSATTLTMENVEALAMAGGEITITINAPWEKVCHGSDCTWRAISNNRSCDSNHPCINIY